jgi:hypothetical protein
MRAFQRASVIILAFQNSLREGYEYLFIIRTIDLCFYFKHFVIIKGSSHPRKYKIQNCKAFVAQKFTFLVESGEVLPSNSLKSSVGVTGIHIRSICSTSRLCISRMCRSALSVMQVPILRI